MSGGGIRIGDRARRRLLAALVVAAGLVALAGPVLVLTGAARGRAEPSGDPFGAGLGADGRLAAATLDVEAGQRTAPITVRALAPGDRATGSIEIVNAGDLPLHYALLLSPTGAPVESWLRWDLWLAPAQGCGGPVPSLADPDRLVADAVLDGRADIALFGRFDPGDCRGVIVRHYAVPPRRARRSNVQPSRQSPRSSSRVREK